jgi:hypothetical protein
VVRVGGQGEFPTPFRVQAVSPRQPPRFLRPSRGSPRARGLGTTRATPQRDFQFTTSPIPQSFSSAHFQNYTEGAGG